jgi:carbon-monoxide dehydrogenase medium subunit
MYLFNYEKASSIKEAMEMFSAKKGKSSYMAGGTDLLVQMKQGRRRPEFVIDLKGIKGMDEILIKDNEIIIGALTSIRTIECSSELKKKVPLLSEAAAKLGSIQVRNKATIGGNLCNASPSADTASPLLALDAKAEIYGYSGSRLIDLQNFFLGPGLTSLQEGEILTHLKIPISSNSQGFVYYKLSTRKAMDLSFVGVAVLLELESTFRIKKARIALSAVAPTPIRALSAEKILEGQLLSDTLAREASELACQASKPISDLRASEEYRKEMVRELCYQGILFANNRAQKSMEGFPL